MAVSNQYGSDPAAQQKQPQYQYDASKDLFYFKAPSGQLLYVSPVNYKGQSQGSGHGANAGSAGFLVDPATWNPLTGKYDPGGHDWMKIIALVAAGVVAPEVASAAFGAPAAVVGAGATTGVEAGATSGLGAAALPGAMATLPAVTAGVGAGTGTAVGAGAISAADAANGWVDGSVMPPAAKTASGIPSWLAPVLGGVTSAVGNVAGAAIQSNASTDAAKIQAQSIADALAFAKQEYAAKVGALTPYVANGTGASDRMSQLLGLPARTGTTATAPPTYGPSVSNYAPPAASGQPVGSSQPPSSANPYASQPSAQPSASPTSSGGPGGATVMLQAPDGTQKAVPADQVAFYLSKGAKQIGAAA